MTAPAGIPGLKTGGYPEPGTTDPARMRERAQANRGRMALLRLEVMTLEREADQLEHDAPLWEARDAADDALDALRQRTAGLRAAEEGTLHAERTAQDALREDKRHLARRQGEVTRAKNGSREAQDDAAARLKRSVQRVAEAETELAEARRKHQEAEHALETHQGEIPAAIATRAAAEQAALNPGVAPLRSAAGEPEMTPWERELQAARAGTTGAGGEPHRHRVTTNAEFAAQDPSSFRMVRRGTQMVAVPPDWRGTGR